jgi:hypothetical protein
MPHWYGDQSRCKHNVTGACKNCKKAQDTVDCLSKGTVVSLIVMIIIFGAWNIGHDYGRMRGRENFVKMHQFADQFIIPNGNATHFTDTSFNKYDLADHLVWVACTYPTIGLCAKSQCLIRMFKTESDVANFCGRVKHDCCSDNCFIDDDHCTVSVTTPQRRTAPFRQRNYPYADLIIV